jgi:hypothetical protein
MLKIRTPFFQFINIVIRNKSIGKGRYLRLLAFLSKMIPAGILGFIENRFYKRKLNRYQPKHPPLYILGHWRSGTSFLQSLLGEAPHFVYHTKFQTFFPESFLITEKTIKQPATSLLQSFGLIDSWHNGIAHNFSSLDTSSEIEISMMTEGKPFSFHWGQVFPKSWKYYFDKYLFWDNIEEPEEISWKNHVKYLNKKVNFVNPKKQLIVKNPGDTPRVKPILDIYPDAKFIFVHRNPYEVFYSSVKLWKKILNNLSLQEISIDEIKDAIIYTYKRVHSIYLEQRELIPEDNLVEIAYEDLRDEPMKTVQKIYKGLGFKKFSEAEQAFKNYLNDITHTPSDYTYETEDIERINQEWDFIFYALNYSIIDTKKKRMVG